MRASLQFVLDSLKQMPAEQLPALLGELEVIRATAMLKMSAPVPAQPHDELLTADVAAHRLGISTKTLYRHAKKYPFTRTVGEGRNLRFSSLGLDTYIRQKNGTDVLTARQHTRIVNLSSR